MLDIDDDEDEHSIEMHLPFIAKVLGKNVKIVPILTGPVNEEMAESYGKIFAPYFDDPSTLFVFSSDFCHWGERFDFTYHSESHGQIWQSIEKLDGEAMNTLQNHDFSAFSKHINSSKNTICGRHVLFLFLKIIAHSKLKVKTKFVKYAQSEQVKDAKQSSVSYASAITFEE
jgi:AmmeMemoRadiSam system protein B